MNRARFVFAATLVGASFVASLAFAQTQATPDPLTTPTLAGKKFTPPLRGQADVELIQPVTKKDAKTNVVVTTIVVKNVSNAPIARLTVDETWYDDKGNTLPGGRGVINGLLQPNEIQTIKIETPYNTKMRSNNWNFSHANGTVKAKKVAKLDGTTGKEPATKTASSSKTTTKKK
jgi:hypothetical protein